MTDPRVALVLSARFRPEDLGDWLGGIEKSSEVTTFANLREAVIAMRQHPFDIVITVDTFPETQGRSLVKGMRRLCPNAPLVVLAAEKNPDPDLLGLAKDNQGLAYFPQPWDQELLIALVRSLIEESEPDSRSPVPSVNDAAYQAISNQLEELQGAISAQSLYLVNSLGQVLAYEGRDDLVQIGEIASLLGGSFAALREVGALLGEDDPSVNLIHRQGDNEDLYALSVGERNLLVLRVPSGAYAPKIGTVWYYARKTSRALAKLLAEMQPQTVPAFSKENIEDELNAEIKNLFTSSLNGGVGGPIEPGQLMDLQSAYESGLIPDSMLEAEEEEDEMIVEKDNREAEES